MSRGGGGGETESVSQQRPGGSEQRAWARLCSLRRAMTGGRVWPVDEGEGNGEGVERRVVVEGEAGEAATRVVAAFGWLNALERSLPGQRGSLTTIATVVAAMAPP